MIDPGMDGRVALVSGTNQGIGLACARALAAQGARVFATYLRERHEDRSVFPAAYYEQRERVAPWEPSLEADLSDPEVIPGLFNAAERALGPVEILVHAASSWTGDTFGVDAADWMGRPLTRLTAATHDLLFAVDSRATALLIAEFARRHVDRGADRGRIICFTTAQSPGFPAEVSYGASKNALESFVASAAEELGRYGITANSICPPATDTGWLTPEQGEVIRADSWLRHLGQPADAAEVVVFLASDQARWLTGQKVTLR